MRILAFIVGLLAGAFIGAAYFKHQVKPQLLTFEVNSHGAVIHAPKDFKESSTRVVFQK